MLEFSRVFGIEIETAVGKVGGLLVLRLIVGVVQKCILGTKGSPT
jgi:hypothetical protein